MAYSTYYRHILNDEQKKVYDTIRVGIMSRQKSISFVYTDSRPIRDIVTSINYDWPELYYVNLNQYVLYKSGINMRIEFKYYVDKATQDIYDKKIKSIALSILKPMEGKRMSVGALLIHDWLVKNVTYGECEQFPNAGHNIIGALVYSECVCEGYAKAYKYLLDLIHMRCIVVTGKKLGVSDSESGHAWNIIKWKKNFYHVDVTHDRISGVDKCSRAHYLLSTTDVLRDYNLDPRFEMPSCEKTESILQKVSGTRELIDFLKSEYQRKADYSEVRLTKGFKTCKDIDSMIKKKLSLQDYFWYNHIDSYWYGEYSRTLFIAWR